MGLSYRLVAAPLVALLGAFAALQPVAALTTAAHDAPISLLASSSAARKHAEGVVAQKTSGGEKNILVLAQEQKSILDKVVALVFDLKTQIQTQIRTSSHDEHGFSKYCEIEHHVRKNNILDLKTKIRSLRSHLKENATQAKIRRNSISQYEIEEAQNSAAVQAAGALRKRERNKYNIQQEDGELLIHMLEQAARVLAKATDGLSLVQEAGKVTELGASVGKLLSKFSAVVPLVKEALNDDVLRDFLSGEQPVVRALLQKSSQKQSPHPPPDVDLGDVDHLLDLLSSIKHELMGTLGKAKRDENARQSSYDKLLAGKLDLLAQGKARQQELSLQKSEFELQVQFQTRQIEDAMKAIKSDRVFDKVLVRDCNARRLEYNEMSGVLLDELVGLNKALETLKFDSAVARKFHEHAQRKEAERKADEARKKAFLSEMQEDTSVEDNTGGGVVSFVQVGATTAAAEASDLELEALIREQVQKMDPTSAEQTPETTDAEGALVAAGAEQSGKSASAADDSDVAMAMSQPVLLQTAKEMDFAKMLAAAQGMIWTLETQEVMDVRKKTYCVDEFKRLRQEAQELTEEKVQTRAKSLMKNAESELIREEKYHLEDVIKTLNKTVGKLNANRRMENDQFKTMLVSTMRAEGALFKALKLLQAVYYPDSGALLLTQKEDPQKSLLQKKPSVAHAKTALLAGRGKAEQKKNCGDHHGDYDYDKHPFKDCSLQPKINRVNILRLLGQIGELYVRKEAMVRRHEKQRLESFDKKVQLLDGELDSRTLEHSQRTRALGSCRVAMNTLQENALMTDFVLAKIKQQAVSLHDTCSSLLEDFDDRKRYRRQDTQQLRNIFKIFKVFRGDK